MSRTYELYVNLTSDRAVPKKSRLWWKHILSQAVDDPESVIEDGVDPDFSSDNDEVDIRDLPDGKTEFSLRLDRHIGIGYGLDAYLADFKKAIYKGLNPLRTQYTLSYSATDKDREPDESGSMTSHELATQYGVTA